jgi:hypothetical protein
LRANIWIKQVNIANAVFRGAGVTFVSAEPTITGDPALVDVDGLKQAELRRRASGADGIITVYFVNAMVPRPPEPGRGEIINKTGTKSSGLIILTNEIGPDTLAHEIGEVLLPGGLNDSNINSNLMSHLPGRRPVNSVDDLNGFAGRLTEEQKEAIRLTVARF